MPSEVRHRVDRGQDYPLVRLAGVLDETSTAQVRSALFDVLATQPEAVVVDIAGLRVTRVEAVGVLREVLDETRDWPGSRLTLCGAADASTWRPSGWPVWPDPAGAFAALGVPDPGSRVSVGLDPAAGAARHSRRVIADACLRWNRPGLADDACIVATEMVNNAVAHAGTPMRVLLALHDGTMSVAVRDGSAVLPRFTGPAAPTSYGGRGLLLIDAIAARWGHLPLDDGKVVWARLEGERSDPGTRPAGMTGPTRG